MGIQSYRRDWSLGWSLNILALHAQTCRYPPASTLIHAAIKNWVAIALDLMPLVPYFGSQIHSNFVALLSEALYNRKINSMHISSFRPQA